MNDPWELNESVKSLTMVHLGALMNGFSDTRNNRKSVSVPDLHKDPHLSQGFRHLFGYFYSLSILPESLLILALLSIRNHGLCQVKALSQVHW